MAVLSWGKPNVEITKSVDGAPAASATWTQLPAIKEDTAKLTTTKGTKKEAIEEGGDLIDARYAKNRYLFEMEVFVKKGDTRPVEDEDGVVPDNYAVRLTPEDELCEGFIMENCLVSVEESWTSADGKTLKYSFDAQKPKTGKTLKPYTKSAVGA